MSRKSFLVACVLLVSLTLWATTQAPHAHRTLYAGILGLRMEAHDLGRQRLDEADEALVTAALDLSGRAFFVWRIDLPKAKLGNWDVELAEVFFEAFARAGQMNLHVHKLEGHNLHHLIEITFKAFAKALRAATEIDARASGLPSTKGSFD